MSEIIFKMKYRQKRSSVCLTGFSEEANQNIKNCNPIFLLETKECINLYNECTKDVAGKK